MPLESIPFAPSSNIQSIWHDPDTQILLIRYHHRDRVYRYPGISGADAGGFAQSLSANDYLQQVILNQSTGAFVGSIPSTGDEAADSQALTSLLT